MELTMLKPLERFWPVRARKPVTMPSATRFNASLDYLNRRSIPEEGFAQLHRLRIKGRPMNLRQLIKHFDGHKRLQPHEHDMAKRIILVADLHRWNEGNFQPLITRALEKHPFAD